MPLILYKNFTATNPVTIGSGVTITGVSGTVSGDAVYAVNYAWTIANAGALQGAGTSGAGLALLSGGSILNHGQIVGYPEGVLTGSTITGAAATIANYGTIVSTGSAGIGILAGAAAAISNLGAIINTGAGGFGIELTAGGKLVNGSPTAAGALISGGYWGIKALNAAATVQNYGTVLGATTGLNAGSQGVVLSEGGVVANLGTASLIAGARQGVYVAGAAGTVTNMGTIKGATGAPADGVDLVEGGVVINGTIGINGTTGLSSALIGSDRRDGIRVGAAPGTVANYGTIAGVEYGVLLGSGGLLTNSGYIASGYSLHYPEHTAVRMLSDGGNSVVINSGTIGGTLGQGIAINAPGTVANSGIVNGGVQIFGSGQATLTNSATGTVSGGVFLAGLPTATLTNSGVIDHVKTNNVQLANYGRIGAGITIAGGPIVNGRPDAATAFIGGILAGVYPGYLRPGLPSTIVNYGTISGAGAGTSGVGIGLRVGGTIANHGTIAGSNGTAVYGANLVTAFGASVIAGSVSTGQLTVHPGASFGGAISGSVLELAVGGSLGTLSGFGTSLVNFGTVAIDPGARWDLVWTTPFARPAPFPATVSDFQQGDTLDATGIVANSYTYSGGVLTLTENGSAVAQATLSTPYANPVFSLTPVGANGTAVTVAPQPPWQSPAALANFSWAQGWGSADNPRLLADVNQDGTSDYVGFGANFTFVAYGGTFADGQGNTGPGFSSAIASVEDFGTGEGYTAQMQRGAADAGVGAGDILYGQGFAGIFWYQATGATPETDAGGNAYQELTYQAAPKFYGNFGSQQGWSPANGFQILKTTNTDPAASILGFGDGGIVVGPEAFAPDATADDSYVLDFSGGNSAATNAGVNFGWNYGNDVMTFTDANGNTLDLNGDGVADFVGMGPQGLEFAFGNDAGPNGSYQLGQLQQAQIGPVDLGRDQGWNDLSTLRYIVADPQSGFDDIIAFGDAGVYIAMGQDPASHSGQPFGQLNLVMDDFGADQGWKVPAMPRLVGDVNGDGIPDIVGFGSSNTSVALGSKDASGNLEFAVDPDLTIGDFGSSQGWGYASPNLTVRALAQFPGATLGSSHADLVLSGAFNTETWQFV